MVEDKPTKEMNRVEMANLCVPKTPKSDEHLISPYDITPESNMKVMRTKGMINDPWNGEKQIVLVSNLVNV